MGRLEKLLPASWKGIPFLVRSEMVTEAGRRIVLHDYPNSNNRYVEDLGEIPPKFSVTAFVSGPDFLDRAAQLERALSEKGRGRLSMPTFGIRSLFALPYKKDASQKEVGEIKFNLEFVAGSAVSGPSRAPDTTQTVYALGDVARAQIGDVLESVWVIPTDTPDVMAAQFDLEQVAGATEPLETEVDNVGDLERAGQYITENTQTIVRSATDMKNAVITELMSVVSVGLSVGRGLEQLYGLTRFGSELSLLLSGVQSAFINQFDILLWPSTTAGRVKRNKNRLSLVNSVRVAALVSAYEQTADAAYSTGAEIDNARNRLEADYRRIMREGSSDSIQSVAAVRDAVEAVRVSALSVLDQKEQTTFTLTTVDTHVPEGALLLAYSLYAEEFTTADSLTGRAVEVRALNPALPADKLNGEVTVVQA